MKKIISIVLILLLLAVFSKSVIAASNNYATSSTYEINEENRFIYKVDAYTPVLNFYSNLTVNSSLTYHVYDKDGYKKEDTQDVVTGDLLMFKNREQYKISVSKDLNGDGKVTIKDLAILQRQLLNPTNEISIEAFLAADTNLDDLLTIKDLASLQRYILNN